MKIPKQAYIQELKALAMGKGQRTACDAGKKVSPRKRYILVDTPGLLLTVLVTIASVQDRDGARLLPRDLPGGCKKLRSIWVDGQAGRLVAWVTLIDTMLSIIAHHGRPVVSQKQWLLLFLLVFFVARALFAARSFLINYGLCGFDDVEHQIRLARLPCWRPCC